MVHPLIVLLLGITTVVGLIVLLRVNAFVALVIAALAVSLLAPGAWDQKVQRVAEAFGSSAAKIGIVIAMAAVIGKCLTDSGAADRIVRSFLKLLGERRAPEALGGAAFVLAMPVFFDTVFYLIVPLARSLYKSTRKNYILYVLAIATGGAVTHTMVPPTPGPLMVAATLNIDLGMMILVGAIIGAPTAAVGLAACRLFNRLIPVPMRPYPGETDLTPPPDESLPPLWLSLLPIILPVLLISGATITKALMGSGTRAGAVAATQSPMASAAPAPVGGPPQAALVAATQTAAASIAQANATAAAPKYLRAAAENLGNANLALLISALVAMGLLLAHKRLSLGELAKKTEDALLSGGLIILITAAGGAFGAMLQQAEVGEAVKQLAGRHASGGMGLIVLGFCIASVLKIAQGSSTVAMLTSAAMIAAMCPQLDDLPAMLGCHPVYLGLAIAAGSLVGSWMNDSGYWIFARMSVLTEAEALKTWTVQLVILGVSGLVFTLLAAWLVPLV